MQEMSLHEYNQQKQTKKAPGRSGFNPKLGMALIAVVLIALGFLGGMQYQKGKTPATKTAATRTSQFGGMGSAGGFQRGNRAIGTVSSVSSTSITVENRRGTTDTYNITSSTTVTNNGSSASVSDIQAGDTVFVTLDSSNTKNASSIALNPSFGGGMGGQPSASSSDNGSDQSTTDTSSI